MSKKFYLAGSMHGLKQYGIRIRNRLLGKLDEYYSCEAFSPPHREAEIARKFEIDPKLLRVASKKVDQATRVKIFGDRGGIIDYDIGWIKKHATAVLVHFTKESAGTISEIWETCIHTNIPVHLVNASGEELNPWLEATILKKARNPGSIHDNWDQCFNYIQVKHRLRKKRKAKK